jgi:uncharacterized membrane protein YebE (DUF533 family)
MFSNIFGGSSSLDKALNDGAIQAVGASLFKGNFGESLVVATGMITPKALLGYKALALLQSQGQPQQQQSQQSQQPQQPQQPPHYVVVPQAQPSTNQAQPSTNQVGRFVPIGTDKILDTATGTVSNI